MVASVSVSANASEQIQEKEDAQKADFGNKSLVKLNSVLPAGVNGASGQNAQAAVEKA